MVVTDKDNLFSYENDEERGELYTVDNHYMNERNRLLTEYFPIKGTFDINNEKSVRRDIVELTDLAFHDVGGHKPMEIL